MFVNLFDCFVGYVFGSGIDLEDCMAKVRLFGFYWEMLNPTGIKST